MLAGLEMSSREAVSEHGGIQPHDCVNAWSVSAAARCPGAVWTMECMFGGCAVGWRCGSAFSELLGGRSKRSIAVRFGVHLGKAKETIEGR